MIDTQDVDIIDAEWTPVPDIRPCMDVPTFVSLIQRGMSQSQIASAYKRSKQAISQWKQYHADEIYRLLQPDSYLALKFKDISITTLDSISQKDLEKASYLQKMTAAGIAVDKYRLLSSQSTANVDLHLHAKLEEELKNLLSQD